MSGKLPQRRVANYQGARTYLDNNAERVLHLFGRLGAVRTPLPIAAEVRTRIGE
jgi:hypothetical protein